MTDTFPLLAGRPPLRLGLHGFVSSLHLAHVALDLFCGVWGVFLDVNNGGRYTTTWTTRMMIRDTVERVSELHLGHGASGMKSGYRISP
jgi:hypothetical protein